jgi:hypothetical protein
VTTRALLAHATRTRSAALSTLATAGAALALATPCALAAEPAITTQPALQPSFSSSVPNYVTRCEASNSVAVNVRSNGNFVSVDAAPPMSGNFTAHVSLAAGQAFTIVVGEGLGAKTYTVRCLPSDFPEYKAQVLGPRQSAYYLTTPDLSLSQSKAYPASTYVAIFDNEGVPVWWYKTAEGIAQDADLDPNGDLSWALETGGERAFGRPGDVRVEQRNLDGALVKTLQTSGSPTDFHEAWPLANGDFLIDSFLLQTNVPVLEPLGTPVTLDVLDASFQELTADGQVAFSWNSIGHISPLESIRYWYFFFHYPGLEEKVLDWQHINAVMPYQNGYLISLRNTGAIYYIDAATGDVVWKLGGTPTPQSLRIIGDPDVATDFGSQHDVRAWPDGTVSVFDNGTRQFRPPRVVRFKIDEAEHTATLVQTLTDPSITFSACCGSARLLPGGNWVVAWGATPYVEELTPANRAVFRLQFVSSSISTFTYRAVPILAKQLTLSALIDAMDTMHPRAPGGAAISRGAASAP